MTKKWLIGAVAAIAVVSLAGVGFSAFTAQATINGRAYAASMDLQIIDAYTTGCYYNLNTPGAPGNYAFTGENAALTSISLTASNLTPGINCRAYVELLNAGSVPINISVALSSPGVNGMCTPAGINCYDVYTLSGIQLNDLLYWVGSPDPDVATSFYNNWVTLPVGGTAWDVVLTDIPFGSTDATPASGAFTLTYTATPEYGS